jgi:hypothetical protein
LTTSAKAERLHELAEELAEKAAGYVRFTQGMALDAHEIEEKMAELLPPDDVYMVPVSKVLVEQGLAEEPVTVAVQVRDDGELDLMFTRHPKLWIVTARWGFYVVRALDAESAIDRAWSDQEHVDGGVFVSAEEYGYQRSELYAQELTLQGVSGVIEDHHG